VNRKSASIIDEISKLLNQKHQVWVRVRPHNSGPHWRRAAVLRVIGKQVVVKPIKHGGREESVDISDVRLWKAMNNKQSIK
jgi:hypothetical protein